MKGYQRRTDPAGFAASIPASAYQKGPVEIFRFDRREKSIRNYGSKGLAATRIAAGEGKHAQHLHTR